MQCIALCLNTSARAKARLGKLVLTIVAFCFEEGVDTMALLARLPLLARKVAILNDLTHALVPVFRRKLALRVHFCLVYNRIILTTA